VTEYAPTGKSADEIRGLWQWVEVKLSAIEPNVLPIVDDQHVVIAFPVAPDASPAMYLHTPAKTAALVS
jgi:chromosome partitioning protein